MKRRIFAKLAAVVSGSTLATPLRGYAEEGVPWATVSLHQGSLGRLFKAGELDRRDYAAFTKEHLAITDLEYEEVFYEDKLADLAFWKELRERSDDAGAKSRIMLSGDKVRLDVPDARGRTVAVDHHLKLADAAMELGCEFLRVRASSEGGRESQLSYAADGVRRVCEGVKNTSLKILVENIKGFSRDASWLVRLREEVGVSQLGLLPDFGNFDGDRYEGLEKMLPHARALCAKAHAFDSRGNETASDYFKIMRLAKEAGFTGCVSVEYVGEKPGAVEGCLKTKALLEKAIAAV